MLLQDAGSYESVGRSILENINDTAFPVNGGHCKFFLEIEKSPENASFAIGCCYKSITRTFPFTHYLQHYISMCKSLTSALSKTLPLLTTKLPDTKHSTLEHIFEAARCCMQDTFGSPYFEAGIASSFSLRIVPDDYHVLNMTPEQALSAWSDDLPRLYRKIEDVPFSSFGGEDRYKVLQLLYATACASQILAHDQSPLGPLRAAVDVHRATKRLSPEAYRRAVAATRRNLATPKYSTRTLELCSNVPLNMYIRDRPGDGGGCASIYRAVHLSIDRGVDPGPACATCLHYHRRDCARCVMCNHGVFGKRKRARSGGAGEPPLKRPSPGGAETLDSTAGLDNAQEEPPANGQASNESPIQPADEENAGDGHIRAQNSLNIPDEVIETSAAVKTEKSCKDQPDEGPESPALLQLPKSSAVKNKENTQVETTNAISRAVIQIPKSYPEAMSLEEHGE